MATTNRICSAVLALVCGVGSGCAETMVKKQISIASLTLSTQQADISRDGIGVGAQLLGFAEFQQGRAPTIEVRWREVDSSQATVTRGNAPTKQRNAKVPLVPVPSLFVAIDNRSDSPIEFKNAKVWLENKSGKKFAALLNPSDVASRVDLYLREHHPKAAQAEDVVDALRARVLKTNLVQSELVVKANSRFDGILVIDLGVFSLKDADAALGSDAKFVLHLENLGGASDPTSIAIPFERAQAQITADCPEKKAAVPANCTLPALD